MSKREPLISLDILVLLISLATTFIAWKLSNSLNPSQIPLAILIVGLTASFLLFGMVFGLSRSEKKAGELDVEHSRLISAIESIPLGLVITDTKGSIVLSNYELTRIFGEVEGGWTLPKIEEKLKNVYQLRKSIDEVLSKHRTLDWEEAAFESKHLSFYLSPIFSEKEGLLGVLILIRDVTEI